MTPLMCIIIQSVSFIIITTMFILNLRSEKRLERLCEELDAANKRAFDSADRLGDIIKKRIEEVKELNKLQKDALTNKNNL